MMENMLCPATNPFSYKKLRSIRKKKKGLGMLLYNVIWSEKRISFCQLENPGIFAKTSRREYDIFF